MVIDRVKRTIIQNKLIERNEHIVVGISGGPDSVCLLHVLRELAAEWNLFLHAVHVNHCLRGDDADEDQRYTEDLCNSLGVPFHAFRFDVKARAAAGKITSEEAGRNVRYEAFEKIKSDVEATERMKGTTPVVKIATAHNLNDQAETLLMRILRGTGTDGLAGIEYIRDGIIIRPLLDVSRSEIEEYCVLHNLNPRIDGTNLEPVYTRNRIRLELLPLLQSRYNENILSALNRLSQISYEDKEYLYSQVEREKKIVSSQGDVRRIRREDYAKLHPAIGKRLILTSLKEIGLLQDMTSLHLEKADKLLRSGGTGDRIEFPGGYGLRLVYGEGELYREPSGELENEGMKQKAFVYPVIVGGVTRVPELNAGLTVKILQMEAFSPEKKNHLPGQNRFSACLDLSRRGISTEDIVIRMRRPGDHIKPLGMKGTKKLQDFFVDEKIPREDRDRIPLICAGQEVLWVVGYRINENYKITKTTTEMVCIEYTSLPL